MRVAYVCTDPGVPVFGTKGASVHVQAVLRVLVRGGAEVHLLSPRSGGPPPADLAEVVVHPLPRVVGDDPAAREVSAIAAAAAVDGVLHRLHRASAIDLVYERYALWGLHAMPWAAAHGVPGVLEVNAPLPREQAEHRHLGDAARAEAVARTAMSAASAVVGVTPAVSDWARRYAVDPRRVHTVANGVDTTRVRPGDRVVTPGAGEPFVVGFVGTLKPWHGLDPLVDAMGRLAADPAYHLLVVGDGPGAPDLRRRARELRLADRVELTGAVRPDDVPTQLRRMDLAVAPYPDLPGFYFSPLKLYEYLAAGLPVVASSVGEIPRTLDQGRLGALAPPGDAAALAAAIAALRRDPQRRRDLRERGRARALEAEWTGVVDRILALVGRSLREVSDAA